MENDGQLPGGHLDKRFDISAEFPQDQTPARLAKGAQPRGRFVESRTTDESLLARVTSLSPADRIKLIGAVWDTLLPEQQHVQGEVAKNLAWLAM